MQYYEAYCPWPLWETFDQGIAGFGFKSPMSTTQREILWKRVRCLASGSGMVGLGEGKEQREGGGGRGGRVLSLDQLEQADQRSAIM